jgi:hypothetical protein
MTPSGVDGQPTMVDGATRTGRDPKCPQAAASTADLRACPTAPLTPEQSCQRSPGGSWLWAAAAAWRGVRRLLLR